MAIRGSALVPSTVTKTVLCVNAFVKAEYRGELFNPHMPTSMSFQSVRELIDIMEAFFDDIAFPQALYDLRSFQGESRHRQKGQGEVRTYADEAELLKKRGTLGTFVLQVQFRQNATWQGLLTWVEREQTLRFRSLLELLRLLTDALEQQDDPVEPMASWKR